MPRFMTEQRFEDTVGVRPSFEVRPDGGGQFGVFCEVTDQRIDSGLSKEAAAYLAAVYNETANAPDQQLADVLPN